MRYPIFFISLLNIFFAQAQNLVPNGSFEEYTTCPTNQGQVERCVGWTSNSASPDYFNRCNMNDSAGVPSNFGGYQDAFDGDGYMGCVTYLQGTPTYRECIQHVLASPLIPGVPVYLSMMVSPGGFGNEPNNDAVRYASSGVGMKFSVGPRASYLLWQGNVALQLSSILSDTSAWIQVSGVYVPDSAYAYVTLGCFATDADIDTQLINSNAAGTAAYAFIDNVCISAFASDCPLSIGIQELTSPIWNMGANPVQDELRIGVDASLIRGASLVIMDDAGRVCLRKRIADGATKIDWSLHGLASGSYFVQLQNPLGRYAPIHIVHTKP